MNQVERHDLNYLIWYLGKAGIDVAREGGDPEPLVHAADFLLFREANANDDFKQRMDATDAGARRYEETEGEKGLAPRAASWERLRAYYDVAKHEKLIKKYKLGVDFDDEADFQGLERGLDE